MPALLEGGCRVTSLREGEPEEHGTLRVFRHAGREWGATAISLRVLELAPGLSPGVRNPAGDEVLYVLAGEGIVFLDGHPERVGPGTGFYLRPGVVLTFENPGPEPVTLVGSRCPDPGAQSEIGDPMTRRQGPPPSPRPFVHLDERKSEISGDRWYRVLVDDKAGSSQVTQFVGAIPPGRAPDHFHQYEEVLCILTGRGRMWAGQTSAPVAPGSCIFLPKGQPHCVENQGDGELRLLGVFYPAGSPAVRYDTT